VARDIEDIKRTQNELRESEERFRTIFEAAQDSIFIKDCDLRYVAVNPSLARLFGMDPAQFAGRTFEDLFGAEDAEIYREEEGKVLQGEVIATESPMDIGGVQRLLDVVIVPMRDAHRHIIGLCGIARDVTETKKLQELADRAHRLEAAGRIAGQVAHDFNNLLGPLVAYPGLIRDELPAKHAVHEFVDDIEKAAEQMADINQQLLTLGRRGHYNLEPLNINDIILQVIERPQACPENVTISNDLCSDLMNVKGGASQIDRALYNLVANALDAMPDGGQLGIKSENFYVNESFGRYNRIPRGEYVKITITDTGTGIPDEVLPHIFDPFFTTKTTDRRRGSGLGLSIVHAVIEDHEGFVDVASDPKQGTTFYLYFPITREAVEDIEVETVVGGNEKILIVDDDPIQREVTTRLLKKLGYQVNTASGGEAAIDFLKKSRHDLLLLDMVMSPGLDGVETYRRALKINTNQKAIMISGFAESKKVSETLQLGAGAFIKKPLTLNAVATAVRKELDRKSKRKSRK
jgi:PAS domain S-box-containing protein